MNVAECERVLESLELLVRCEEAVGAFYQACAVTWPGDTAFWSSLAEEEAVHGVRLELLLERVRADLGAAHQVRSFPAAAIRTFLKGVTFYRERVQAGNITTAMALALARDLERSLIESQALRTVSFKDPAWQHYLRAIAAETHDHAQRIEERLGREVAVA